MQWETVDRYMAQIGSSGKRCLVFDGTRNQGSRIVMSRGFRHPDGKIDWDNNGELKVLKPTHWMLLPDEPQQWKAQAVLSDIKAANYARTDLS